jgi:hypothetical protein
MWILGAVKPNQVRDDPLTLRDEKWIPETGMVC